MFEVKWDLTRHCNAQCSYCSNGPDRARWAPDLRPDQAVAVSAQLARHAHQIRYLSIMGGEPTEHGALPAIVERLAGSGISIAVVSNGYNHQRLAELVRRGVPELRNITLSLDSHQPAIAEAMRGPGSYERTLAGLEAILAARRGASSPRLEINTVLERRNLSSLAGHLEACHRRGVDAVNLYFMVPMGRGLHGGQPLSMEEKAQALHHLGTLWAEEGERWRQEGFNFALATFPPLARDWARIRHGVHVPLRRQACRAGFGLAYLDNTGHISPCERLVPRALAGLENPLVPARHGSLLETSFGALVEGAVFKAAHRMAVDRDTWAGAEPCRRCPYLLRGCTPCPAPGPAGRAMVVHPCRWFIQDAHLDLEALARPRQPPPVPPSIPDDAVFMPAPKVALLTLEDRHVLFDAEKGRHHVIRPRAAALWRRIQAGLPPQPAGAAERRFLGFLLQEALIRTPGESL